MSCTPKLPGLGANRKRVAPQTTRKSVKTVCIGLPEDTEFIVECAATFKH